MADLYNLLDEIDEDGYDYPVNDEYGEDKVNTTSTTLGTEEDGEESLYGRDNEVPELPHALVEAKAKQNSLLDDAYDYVENGEMDMHQKKHINFEDNTSAINDFVASSMEEDNDNHYKELKRLWTQEIASPELLEYDHVTMTAVTQKIHERLQYIEDMEAQTTQNNRRNKGGNMHINALLTSVLKVDVDRIQFILSDLLRCRLRKIQKYPLFMRQWIDRMSNQEIEFLKGYGQLLERHLNSTVLDHMPKAAWKRLDAPEMIDEPNLEQYVFIRALETIEINNSIRRDEDQSEEDSYHHRDIQQYPKGTLLIVRYNVIQNLVHEKKVELC